MVVSDLIEKIQKELGTMWHSETDLPDSMPGGLGGRTIPKNQVSIAVFILLTLLLAMIFWNAAANTDTVGLPGGGGGGNVDLDTGAMDPINGNSAENSQQEFNVSVEEKAIAEITYTLTWEDEQANPGFSNDPDEFSLAVNTSWGEYAETPMTENGGDGRGEVSLTFAAPGVYPDTGSAGEYIVTVTMGEAGDEWPLGIPSAGFNDPGNDWTLTVTYTYWKEASEPVQE
jgi:hypothetical protein